MWSKPVGQDDMTMLRDVSDEAVAENLKHRLNAGIIYTYIGRVLIAVNPYKALDIYGADTLEVYCKDGSKVDELECEMRGITVPLHRDRVSRCSTAKLPAFEPHTKYLENLNTHKGPKPPHIYGLTTDMYHNMMIEKENQCVIISGESGAGKTTSARHILSCIKKVSGRGSDRIQHIKDIIAQSQVVLEAFGNAKTIRNNNSSRFCRVTHLTQGERNFHVFYQLLSGCTSQEKGQYGLQGNAENFFYLNQSEVYTTDNKDDKNDFLATRTALDVIGVDTAKQQIIFKVLSAILTLGNIEFKETENVACPTKQNLLESLSQILGINRESLEEKLVSVFVETRRCGRVEITKKTNNKCQAVAARDTLSKALYSHLFDYLVKVINGALKKDNDYLSIGILDIYGFESFKENSFEQFAINYVDEKLQQVFVELTFTIEQEEYIREGIAWKTVNYFNNKIVCDLIESKRPSGIMSALDEACCPVKSKKEGSERTFEQKMREIVGSNKAHQELLQVHHDYFTVKHFAGSVDYEFSGFRERNKDELSNDLISLMQSSENSFVRDLFPETVYGVGQGGHKTNTGSAKIKVSKQNQSRLYI
ncbi:unconventional myosin-If-like [Pocillopora verrucosa]|uniref:unconventional myosin-If-like n=1 Tax=Pocillopora verrucosa TaxID=203993 RepID=UPI00333E72D5